MRRTSFLILLFLPFGAGWLGAEVQVTEAIFLAAVDDVHPASRALAGDLGAAEAERLRAALLSDPRLDVLREAPEGVARETILGIAWRPPIDGRRRRAVDAAEAGVEAERHGLESRLSRQRIEVRAAYAAWAAGDARVAVRAENSGRLEALATRMRNRAEAGEESTLAARRLEVAFQSSKIGLSQAKAAAAGSRARAAAWLGDADWDPSTTRPEMPELPKVPEDLDPDLGWALRPDLSAAHSRVEQAESLDRLSRRVLAAPELLLGWKSIEDQGRDFDGPVFALAWEIPVFDRRRADKAAAESAIAAAVAGEEWATRRARSELTAALAAYEELRASALSAKDDLGGLAEVAVAATAAFEQGEGTVTDLLGALQAVLGAHLATLDLYFAALEAHRQLEFAAGRSLTSGALS